MSNSSFVHLAATCKACHPPHPHRERVRDLHNHRRGSYSRSRGHMVKVRSPIAQCARHCSDYPLDLHHLHPAKDRSFSGWCLARVQCGEGAGCFEKAGRIPALKLSQRLGLIRWDYDRCLVTPGYNPTRQLSFVMGAGHLQLTACC